MELNLESLGFNPKSKLAVGLVDIFRELKVFPTEQPETSDFDKLFFDTVTYFENTSVPALKKLIENTTGILVEKVYCRELYVNKTPNTSGCFSMIIRNSGPGKNDNWFRDASSVISGGANKKAHISVETADHFNTLLSNLDSQVGRFKPAKNLEHAVKCDLIVDMSMIVFVDKVTHNKLMPLTAEEAAAVLIHELYHIISTVSYLKYANYSIEVLRSAFDHFVNYASVEEKYKFLNQHMMKKTGVWGKEKDTKDVAIVLDNIGKTITTTPNMEVSVGGTTLQLISQILDMLLKALFLVFYMPFMLAIQMMSFRISEIAFYDTRDGFPKTTDYKAINRQRYEMERIADEGVASHNMSAYLQSALQKVNAVVVYNTGKDNAFLGGVSTARYSNESKILFHFNNFIGGAKVIMHETMFGAFSSYAPLQDRIGDIAKAQLKMVRSVPGNNPFVLEMALDEYDKTYLASKNMAALDVFRKGNAKLLVLLQNLFTILTFGLMNANQRRHVEEILRDAEAIMNNDLYASTARVQLLYLQSA